jgi:hypothetical protein
VGPLNPLVINTLQKCPTKTYSVGRFNTTFNHIIKDEFQIINILLYFKIKFIFALIVLQEYLLSKVVLTINPVSHVKSYQWFRNNDTLKGATNTYIIVKVNATYYAVVQSIDNCSFKSNTIQSVLGTRPAPPIITRSGSLLTATAIAHKEQLSLDLWHV